ncbi:helicase-related protein [Altererythrobacter sp. TH136]|uniref:helicase-related protein n=1 Tax=Altererythrobacter sp. TH136 TaxID=2067415 RepID=UPI001FEE48DE|nr:helicase-related protein [Altererythrobacter sp. TH136]
MPGVTIKAVLGPTNTGKTHLAIERMCGHSSGAIGFPLRLLAREVYDRVVRIKGEKSVALITGEERIEPRDARYFCCTAEAMPRLGGGHAFVALDEAQLSADRERGHVFTDRLLNARGREETMLLGSSTLEPMIKALIPKAEIVTRPRFSTLTYAGARKLSRLPPRSAIVAFSTEQVYAMAEMLRRFRGGAAVVMGGLSPETRNRQVALFQSGEVDYIVATDAIGMGLNLDVTHVAFAGLSKFDGVRQRRLTPAEMAQIAGRAGRHQQDGSFGTLSGSGTREGGPEFTDEEVYAIEEHRFAPLTSLYWREAEPRFDTVATLIADLESPPPEPGLARAPEAVDLAVLKRLAEDRAIADVRGHGMVRRLWEAASLPDFRQSGPDTHARFVARLWQDLRQGHLGADYVAARIAELDRPQGDIDTLQGRIAAIRSWAYIAQRPDWVLARDEMAARARAVEARLSDALHARLTERFVNRRTTILMKSIGTDAALLPVALGEGDVVTVEDEPIGHLEAFRFVVDHQANHADRRMLLAAAEKALPRLLGERARSLAADPSALELAQGEIRWQGKPLAHLGSGPSATRPRIVPSRDLAIVPDTDRQALLTAVERWLAARLSPLAPLTGLEAATRDPGVGSEARALLLALVGGHGAIPRDRAGTEHLPREARPLLRRLGVTFGALDVFAPALLKPAARRALHATGIDRRPVAGEMPPVLAASRQLPAGYRPAGDQAVRVDVAEKLVRAAHDARVKAGRARHFTLDPALATSTGLKPHSWARLLGAAGFKVQRSRALAQGAFGPPAPDRWTWRPARPAPPAPSPAAAARQGNAFAALADLVRP